VSKKYKVSFVIPVYNSELYLDESIDSIINQTLGFEKNIQLVIVNDGSQDNSGEIAKRYQKKYPENIVYIEQENAGVSAARNVGIERAEGRYIGFLDSDDILSSDAAQSVYDFFEEHYEEIDVVAVRLVLFGGKTGPTPLDFKFKKDAVIDVEEQYNYVQLSGGSVFIKAEAIQGKLKFDTKLKRSEDLKFLTELILEKKAYGVLAKPICWYRKAEEKTSAIDLALQSHDWYFDTPKHSYLYVLKHSKKKFGRVLKYAQYIVAYDLQWRITQREQSTMSDEEVEKYKELLTEILQYIDDEIIFAQESIFIESKHKLLSLKYKEDVVKTCKRVKDQYYYNDFCIYDYGSSDERVRITNLAVDGEKQVDIEGTMDGLIMPGASFGFLVDEVFYLATMVRRTTEEKKFLGELVFSGNSFEVKLPIRPGVKITPVLKLATGKIKQIDLEATYRSRLFRVAGRSFREDKNYLICWSGENSLVFIERTPLSQLKKEIEYHVSLARGIFSLKKLKEKMTELYSAWQLSPPPTKMRIAKNTGSFGLWWQKLKWPFDAITLRIAYYITKPYLSKRKIWLISDKFDTAGDNGEVFFRFLATKPENNIKCFFVVRRSSPDYRRMKQYGKVLDWNSWLYKLYFLHADKVISAQADDYVINAFGEKNGYFIGLFKFDFVFLQHGIIKDDLSRQLNKYSKNIKLFITSASKEKESITLEDYGYQPEEVVLTGMPRYDLLESSPKRKIIIAPTWHVGLVGLKNLQTNTYGYNPNFKESEYFQFYSELLNSEKITKALEKYDYTMELYLHPFLKAQVDDFSASSPRVKIKTPPYDYQKMFKEGSLLVTDFSSVFFDFAYLDKPVIYTQFNEEAFFDGHIYNKGYFDYEKHGFGEVLTDLASSEESIISYIKNDCQMKTKYLKRKNNFYAWHDRNNSQRVYEAILKFDSESDEP